MKITKLVFLFRVTKGWVSVKLLQMIKKVWKNESQTGASLDQPKGSFFFRILLLSKSPKPAPSS